MLSGLACLVEALGTDLHERWRDQVSRWVRDPRKVKTAHLGGMVERIRQRRHRRGLGLRVAPLHDKWECVWCGESEPTKKKAERNMTAIQWRQEYVGVHKECLPALLREPQVLVYTSPSRRAFYVL